MYKVSKAAEATWQSVCSLKFVVSVSVSHRVLFMYAFHQAPVSKAAVVFDAMSPAPLRQFGPDAYGTP